MMIIKIFNKNNKKIIKILNNYLKEELKIFKEYIRDYSRKLQLVEAFGKEWDENEIKWLRENIEEIMKIDVSEKEIIKKNEKSIREIIKKIKKRINNILNNKLKEEILKELKKIYGELEVLEKNLELQEKWFKENKTKEEQDKNKKELINLIRMESGILFNTDIENIQELLIKINKIKQEYGIKGIEENTYWACEEELKKELKEFDKDRFDFTIKKTKKLGGGYKNPVLLIETTNQKEEYVGKGFTEKDGFIKSLRAREFIMAAGGKIPKLIRIGDNEIICEKVKGISMREIYVSKGENVEEAFQILGKVLAKIHKNTLNKVKWYDLGTIFRSNYTKDFVKLKKDLKKIRKIGFIDKETYKKFLKLRKEYFPKYISIIHGDAHLDNFFFVPDKKDIIIIDYEDAKPGDPLADVGRVVSSIRDWQARKRLEENYVEKIIQSFFKGYKSVLDIDLRSMDLYEMRLYLIVIRSSTKLYEKIKKIIKNNKKFKERFGKNIVEFFEKDVTKAKGFLYDKEIDRCEEIKFCLKQIKKFSKGEKIKINEKILSKIMYGFK